MQTSEPVTAPTIEETLPDERPATDTSADQPATDPLPGPHPAAEPPLPTVPDDDPLLHTESYEPTLKKGIHRLLCSIATFGPRSKYTLDGSPSNEVDGWSLGVTTLQEADDSSGGKIEAGKMLRANLFTTPGDRGTAKDTNAKLKRWILALNGQSFGSNTVQSIATQVDQAYAALPPDKRLPRATDTEQTHYDQWVGGQVVVVFNSKVDADGTPRLNCLGIEAASTAKV